MKNVFTIILIFIIFLLTACSENNSTEPAKNNDKALPQALHTDGRWIRNEDNEIVILRGVNIASLEWTAGGDHMIESTLWTIEEWNCNVLRIPLAQDRWYGYAPEQSDDGSAYRELVDLLIQTASERKTYIWLDLHWNNANVWGAYIGQHKMPDTNSVDFWQDVANLYANHPAVMFGLYNEPHDITWEIWRNGGTVEENYDRNGTSIELTYEAAGHQELVDAIREQGADNIIIAGGLDWGFDLQGIANGYALDGENIVYDTHPYPWKPEPWDKYFGNVGLVYPIIVGEWGGTKEEGHQPYGVRLADYMRRNHFSWTAWCFHPSAGPQLIKNWDYDPTWFGQLVMQELAEPVSVEE